ncbi:GNAT family N-acetyltransferase [Engelhardtia mirabilis]|uniref:Uncharacterized protein n=1 Tax=Engelhardtia mirabilis TaxID=2528011 RepID=A0A518BK87_9BACT|nr:hypothetical protein Pla133_24690 [Planctomycetes bacterium Pla133]QDV01713.1 hypothetical protein Pla86_24680 [Planctomycetes bacterium Pla86]
MSETTIDPSQVPNEALQLHGCGPEDRAEQARLFNACFKKGTIPEELRWRYDDCPHGSAVSFVSRPPGGEGISGYACNPRRVLAFGDESTATLVGQTGDVMTHPDWRKRGIFSSLDRASMVEAGRRGWAAVFGLPNRRSAHIFLELGWDQIGLIRPWSFVLRSGPEARALRFTDGRLASLLLPATGLRCRRGEARLRRAAAGYSVAPLSRFPEEVCALSKRVEREFPFMVRRDAAYLNWRFIDNPAELHAVLGIHAANGDLAGYVVVQRPRAGEHLGYLVDVLAPDPGARAAAILAGLEDLRAAGAAMAQATAVDDSWWMERLVEAGFLPPKAENHLIVIRYAHDRDHPVVAGAERASSWYLTDGDRDDTTMG